MPRPRVRPEEDEEGVLGGPMVALAALLSDLDQLDMKPRVCCNRNCVKDGGVVSQIAQEWLRRISRAEDRK